MNRSNIPTIVVSQFFSSPNERSNSYLILSPVHHQPYPMDKNTATLTNVQEAATKIGVGHPINTEGNVSTTQVKQMTPVLRLL